MDLYLKIFGNQTVRELEIFRRHHGGETFEELSKEFNISRQRCHQISSTVKNNIELFTALMRAEIAENQEIERTILKENNYGLNNKIP